jgi:hypothetical protein
MFLSLRLTQTIRYVGSVYSKSENDCRETGTNYVTSHPNHGGDLVYLIFIKFRENPRRHGKKKITVGGAASTHVHKTER